MSQIGVSRPGTQQSLVSRLPEIQHPLSRLGTADSLGVRGLSRSGPHERIEARASFSAENTRPLSNEVSYRASRRLSAQSLQGSVRCSLRAPDVAPYRYESIPEGVEVTHGDPNKTRLPLFGNRAEMGSRGELFSRGESRGVSRLSRSSSQLRLEIDEMEMILKEKVKHGYYDIKKRFKDNDPEQRGNVSRDAFCRILVTILGRPLSQSQFSRLSERLGFKDKSVVKFSEFFAHFRQPQEESDYPRWLDPVHRHWQDKPLMSASQVHMHLKEKAKQKVRDIADLIPQSNPDGTGSVLKPEFRNVLNQLGFPMDDNEFDKLWAKYDTEGTGVINGEKMMRKLGISIEPGDHVNKSPEVEPKPPESRKTMRKLDIDRQRSLDIEEFMKERFREGFHEMKKMFEDKDPSKSGMVSHDDFVEVIRAGGLRLDKSHLSELLSRCSVTPTRHSVPYQDFLHRFQDRSEDSMVHTILTNPKHSYNRGVTPGQKSTISHVEAELMTRFQRDFLSLLGTFHNIDKLGEDVISKEAFRAAIESRFDLEMTDDQYDALIDRVPLDDDGAVKYAEFMAQFDTKGSAKSLFGEPQAKKNKSIGPLPRDPSPLADVPEEMDDTQEVNRLSVHTEDGADYTTTTTRSKRSTVELFKVIKELLKKHYSQVEETFYEIDDQNTRRITQEMMYQLLRKFDVQPPITRGEIRDLWRTFITNQDKTLDFLQFVRHFGYSLKSAAFPNAKVQPPVRGDSDCLIRSRKLNCASIMLKDSLRSKIDYMWEQLYQEFTEMDPYSTGYVSVDEFRDVLTELCVHLTEYELKMIVRQFDVNGDNRISYVEFLKPFAIKREIWRHGNNMVSVLGHPPNIVDLAPDTTGADINTVLTKLREKFYASWKRLRRGFKKIDVSNEGLVSVADFRDVLKQENCALDEEEVYQLLSKFDENLTGKICYPRFLSETFRPSCQNQARLLTQSSVF